MREKSVLIKSEGGEVYEAQVTPWLKEKELKAQRNLQRVRLSLQLGNKCQYEEMTQS